MEKSSSEILIPKAAIRTMDKDLAGVAFEEWEETLAETEILELLKNFKGKTEEKKEPTPQEIEQQQKLDEAKRLATEEQQKRFEAEKRETESMRKEKLAAEKKEQDAILKIRAQAKEVDALVKERMKSEEEKYEEQEQLKRSVVESQQQEETLKLKKKELEEALAKIPEEKKPLDETKAYLFKERGRVQQSIDPIAESERKIEENIKLVSRIEDGSSIPLEKRRAEKERQVLEIEREKIEQSRWTYEKELFDVEEKLKELESQYQDLAGKEAKLMQQQKEIVDGLSKIDKKKERKQKEDLIEKLTEEKTELSRLKDQATARKKEIDEKLAEVTGDERKTEKEEEYLKHEEEVAKGPDRQKIEMERHRLEGIRTELEKKRWRLEDEGRKVSLEESRLNIKYSNLLEKENLLREEIDEINKVLGIVSDTPKAAPRQPSVPDKRAIDELKKREGEYTKKYGPDDESEQAPDESVETDEARLAKEALKRIEEKREKEALLKKIGGQKEQESKRKEDLILERLRSGIAPVPGQQEGVMPQPAMMYQQKPERPWIKITIIAAIAAVVLGILIFIIVRLTGPEEKLPPVVPPVITIPIPTTPIIPVIPPVVPPATEIWPSLISGISRTEKYTIDQNTGIPGLLAKIYAGPISNNEFVRIAIKNQALDKYVGLSDFADSQSLDISDDLLESLDDQTTHYIYQAQGKKSIGWVAKRISSSNQNLTQLMQGWENNLSKNAFDLGLVLSQKNMKSTCTFKTQKYKDYDLRTCELITSPGCYGSCYAITQDYLIYSSCCTTVKTLIDDLTQ